jgi:hypothetical protein
MLNGKPLSDSVNIGTNVRIDPYDPKMPNQQTIVDANAKFAPDIIVLVGTAESVTQVMQPLEGEWQSASRPEYVLIDSAKVPELLTAVTGNDDLRRRVRGTGVTPSMRSIPVNDAFMVSYATRYPNMPANIYGLGPAYDSTYAVGYAIASLRGQPITGANIGQGLRRLSGGATTLEVQSNKILAAFNALASGQALTVIGTFGTMQWNDNGAIQGGTIELWCVGNPNNKPTFATSGLTYDIQSSQALGMYTQCAP